MATFNVSVDLDWIEEDGSLEEMIQQRVFNGIQRQITERISSNVIAKAEKEIQTIIEATILDEIGRRIREFLDQPRNITDRYGDVLRENVTIETMLKEQLEKAIDVKTLDEDGKPTSYNPKFSVFQYFVSRNFDSLVKDRVHKCAEETMKHVEQTIKDKIKGEVAENLTQFILDNSATLSIKPPTDQ